MSMLQPVKDNRPGNLKWPVIINSALQGTEIMQLLQLQQLKVRVSDSTPDNSVIFPVSGVTFIVFNIQEGAVWFSSNQPSAQWTDICTKLEKIVQVHRRCYMICMAAIHTEREQQTLSALQHRFLLTSLQMLPVHNSKECVDTMLTIAKASCKPENDALQHSAMAQISHLFGADSVKQCIMRTGLEERQCQYLLDNLGSIQMIANADTESLLDCCLDVKSARLLQDFFNEDRA